MPECVESARASSTARLARMMPTRARLVITTSPTGIVQRSIARTTDSFSKPDTEREQHYVRETRGRHPNREMLFIRSGRSFVTRAKIISPPGLGGDRRREEKTDR